MAAGRVSGKECVCVYAQCGCGTIATSGDPGAPDPTIAFPCARRFTDTSSLACGLFKPAHTAPRSSQALVCPAVLGTASLHLHLGCLVQMFSLWARAGFGNPGSAPLLSHATKQGCRALQTVPLLLFHNCARQ